MRKTLPTITTPTWVFLFSIVIFIVLKFPHLGVPFFWDEAGVYGHMAFQLADKGLSLHPNAIDEWTSKGHPLLYVNYLAGFCSLFGTTVFVAHLANFLLTLALLGSMFFHVSKIFNQWAALWSTILLMSVPLFFTQAVFVLPEIGLALALWWTSWAFIHKKYFLYFLCGSIAMLTKEPALIWVGALFLYDLIRSRNILKSLLWLTPVVTLVLFLLVQKQTHGWYFFPYHTGGFDFAFQEITTKFWEYLKFLFWKNGRFIWLIIVLLGLYTHYFRVKQTETDQIRPRTVAVLVAAACYLLFHTTTFYGDRYIMPVTAVVSVCVGYSFFQFFPGLKKIISVVILIPLLTFSALTISSKTFNYDNDMSYLRAVNATQKGISYMLERGMLEQGKFSATMPVIFSIQDSRFGYLPKGSPGLHSTQVSDKTLHVIQLIPGTAIENPNGFKLDTLIKWNDHDIQTIIFKTAGQDSTSISQ